ncbi:MAG: glycosyltransferase family 2 protein [Myxococcota bacterium]|nr:glycosyltransferase family 2 protein [Myxococcota bacterium]MDP7570198.1 glycosyltransferase family 2 protein [Myxococcota bacterium]
MGTSGPRPRGAGGVHSGGRGAGSRTAARPGVHRLSAHRPDLSLVFPVFDEEESLGPLLDAALALAPRLAADHEIIVVDDGSRDASAAVAADYCRRNPSVRLLRHAANRGYGAALRAGLQEARGELVFFTDADLQFDLSQLSDLLSHARDFDIVAGYREPRRDPWGRRGLAWIWGSLVNRLFGLRVRDIDCAFKVFRRHVIETISIASLGAFINTEILVRAKQSGFRIHQIPVTHRRRRFGRQSGASPRVIVRALLELVSLARELRRDIPHTLPIGEER